MTRSSSDFTRKLPTIGLCTVDGFLHITCCFDWTKASRLRLNTFKTEVMWLAVGHAPVNSWKSTIRNVPRLSSIDSRTVVDSARNLGVNTVTGRTCCCSLPQVSAGLMRRVQSVRNATARLVTGARRRDHITPILRQLHAPLVARATTRPIQDRCPGLPVSIRQCADVSGRRLSLSSSPTLFARPTWQCVFFDDRRLQLLDHACMWNSLPSKLRQCDSFEEFKRLLKTRLFGDHRVL